MSYCTISHLMQLSSRADLHQLQADEQISDLLHVLCSKCMLAHNGRLWEAHSGRQELTWACPVQLLDFCPDTTPAWDECKVEHTTHLPTSCFRNYSVCTTAAKASTAGSCHLCQFASLFNSLLVMCTYLQWNRYQQAVMLFTWCVFLLYTDRVTFKQASQGTCLESIRCSQAYRQLHVAIIAPPIEMPHALSRKTVKLQWGSTSQSARQGLPLYLISMNTFFLLFSCRHAA